MIDFPACREFIRPWIVCEATDRWHRAVGRFAPQMMPRPLIPAIEPAESTQVREKLSGQPNSGESGYGLAVVLWEARRDSLAATCDCLAQTAIAFPNVLQLVAGSGLSNLDQIVLSEFRSAALISHPEDLPRLTRMIQGYFATSDENVD